VSAAIASHYSCDLSRTIEGILKDQLPKLISEEEFLNELVENITRNIGPDSELKNIVKTLRESKEISDKFLARFLEAAVIRHLGSAPLQFDMNANYTDTLD